MPVALAAATASESNARSRTGRRLPPAATALDHSAADQPKPSAAARARPGEAMRVAASPTAAADDAASTLVRMFRFAPVPAQARNNKPDGAR
jgi:hypothetical protein